MLNTSADPAPEHPSEAATPVRRIGLQHMAFVRGYFEGLDVAALGEQYLSFGRDRRSAEAARKWIIDELVAAARKRGDSAGARLLKLPAGSLPNAASAERFAIMDLEAFREITDPDGVYSETELLAFYKESQHPDTRRVRRNARLRHRQRALLERLEASLAEPPRVTHRVGDWLDPALAARLDAAGLARIDDLITFINRKGYRWYKRVPRVGEQAANRIAHWLQQNAQALGKHLSLQARLPRSKWPGELHANRRRNSGKLVPIEHDEPLEASQQADRDALLRCLARFESQPATFRAYRVQADRLLLWARHVRGRSLAQLDAADAQALIEFMAKPIPQDMWCGPKADRGTAEWRPYEAAVEGANLARARRILMRLCDGLCQTAYIETNPFKATRPPTGERLPANDSLPVGPIDVVAISLPLPQQEVTETTPAPTLRSASSQLSRSRIRAVLLLLRDTGLTLETLVRLPVHALSTHDRRLAVRLKGRLASTAASKSEPARQIRECEFHRLQDDTIMALALYQKALSRQLGIGGAVENGVSGDLQTVALANPYDLNRSASFAALDSATAEWPLFPRHQPLARHAAPKAVSANVLARAIRFALSSYLIKTGDEGAAKTTITLRSIEHVDSGHPVKKSLLAQTIGFLKIRQASRLILNQARKR